MMNNIANKLPEGYNGPIPDEYLSQLPQIGGNKNESEKQEGGSGNIVPPYKDLKNTPFKSTESKFIKTKQEGERSNIHRKPESTPIIEFKVNDNILNKNFQQPKQAPIYPSFDNFYTNPWNPYLNIGQMGQQAPTYKNYYTLNMPGPSGEHLKISTIYEDVLPVKIGSGLFVNSFVTLGERLIMYAYVRSIFVKHNDGEYVDMTSDKNHKPDRINLFHYIKLMDINPYHFSRLTNNPYKSLPSRMLMYRSCYPQMFDPVTNMFVCAKTSIGMNIRIYEMNVGELNIKRLSNSIKFDSFDLWREVSFYEFIREEVVKRKISPNFINMFCYFISDSVGVKFNKLRNIKKQLEYRNLSKYSDRQKMLNEIYQKEFEDQITDTGNKDIGELEIVFDRRNTIHDEDLDVKDRKVNDLELQQYINGSNQIVILPSDELNPIKLDKKISKTELFKRLKNIKVSISHGKDKSNIILSLDTMTKTQFISLLRNIDLTISTNETLVVLTESPTYNLLNWATRTYESFDGWKKMIDTGFHTEDIWNSILFQMLIILGVLYKYKIAFNKFTIEDNIYIKDIASDDQIIGYWKYKINGIDYYVPNYGYLVVCDSNFKDIDFGDYSLNQLDKEYMYKIYSRQLYENDRNKLTDIDIEAMLLENFKNIINPNVFGPSFTNSGGVRPSEYILNIISSIYSEVNNTNDANAFNYIYKYFRGYMNNRVGTYMKPTETVNIIQQGHNFNQGQMVAYQLQQNVYQWALYVEAENAQNSKVLLRGQPVDTTLNTDIHGGQIIESSVNTNSLFGYSVTERVEQTYKAQISKLSEDDLLETYIIN